MQTSRYLWVRAGLRSGCLALVVSVCWSGALAAEPWTVLLAPDNSLNVGFLKDGQPAFQVALGGWGPKWAWVGLSSKEKATGERFSTTVPFVVNRAAGERIEIQCEAWKSAAREMTLRYDLTAAKDVPVTMVIAGLSVDKALARGATITLTHLDGQQSTLSLPLKLGSKPAASKAVLSLPGVGEVVWTLDPPCPIAFDGDLRIQLAVDTFKQGTRRTTLTCALPGEATFVARPEELDRFIQPLAGPDWFAFTPSNADGPSVIGMNDWLEHPAGKRGGVRSQGDRFQFEDGTPIKFWGVNLSYGGGCAPSKGDADFTAARYAKYGVNAVRLHKFSYPKNQMGIGSLTDSTQMDPAGLDRLDYFSAQLKKQGVYFGWSHTFGFHVVAGDRARLRAYDEIEKNLKGNTYAFINFAEDVQDLMIEMVVNLLKHKNPYTERTYAEEPALSFIELQNEDDIFFYTSQNAFKACPTYQQHFTERFSDWLKAKYGSEENLRKAWGTALKAGESLGARNLVPETNPWFFGEDNLPKQKGGDRQRLLDAAQHLHELQNQFYSRFVKAIRAAGYQGPLNGSPWQAPSMVPHYYNLRSDYLVGYIDRHNYFGGKLSDSMLAKPGSGYFSSGLQQVVDRPFGLSEWIHVYPSLYSAEGPAILAAYGFGLQGWDASYEFQSQSSRRLFSERVGWPPWGVWEADVPTQLGQYPALARMILRGDVKEGEVISVRRVGLADLAEGKFDFSDKVSQQGDIKTFGGTVPPEALAAGRVVVEFAEAARPSTFPDLTKYRQGSVIVSSTKELAWETAGQGFFTVNTPGTKAVVGFAAGKELALDNMHIQVQSPYASLFMTALDRQATLANTKSALLCAVARNCNSGFKYFVVDQKTIENGRGPILLEPVRATVVLSGRPIAQVNILDHDGRRTDRTLPVQAGRFTLDGAKDKALYYEVVFQ